VYVSCKLAGRQLRGRAPVSAKPANLLLEQPTKFGRIINLRMAKTIALTASQSLLLRPDEVIQ